MLSLALWGCGSDSGDPFDPNASSIDIWQGTVRGITGSQAEMASWVLVLLEADSGQARVSQLGALGNYSLRGVNRQSPQTLVLLDPFFRFKAVLSQPAEEGGLYQYFSTGVNQLPGIIQNGPTLSFTDSSDIIWEALTAKDEDGDYIADGLGLVSELGPDIDEDGIPNWFDDDTDGDRKIDIFDPDHNGNDVQDAIEQLGDVYFTGDVSYVLAQVVQDITEDEGVTSYLYLRAKAAEGVGSIQVRGPQSLFAGASALISDPSGGPVKTAIWDEKLSDDGLNDDGVANDGLHSKILRLAEGVSPQAKQAIFFGISKGSGDEQYLVEYPFSFPELTTKSSLSGVFDPDLNKITRQGSAFEGIDGYYWSVVIFDASGVKVFSSKPLVDSLEDFTLPDASLEVGQEYQGQIVASALGRVPSFPSWVIRSAKFSITPTTSSAPPAEEEQ